jgi:hypothetical protein
MKQSALLTARPPRPVDIECFGIPSYQHYSNLPYTYIALNACPFLI